MRRLLWAVLGTVAVFGQALYGQAAAQLPRFSTILKANSTIKQVSTDAQGNVYVLGETNVNPATGYARSVFVARLDPTAASLKYEYDLTVSGIIRAGALTVDSSGNAYLAGFVNSSDFPSLPAAGAPTPDTDLPFAAKVNGSGQLVYAVLFSQGKSGTPQAIAVDSSGNAIVSGVSGTVPATAGAYNNAWNPFPPFVTKLDPTGSKVLFSATGVGGSRLVLDSSGNIFIAGTAQMYPGQYPTTAGAFQTTFTPVIICPPTPCMLPQASGQQYVTKLSADGSKLLFSTFVTGSLGAYNAGMAVDAAGDVWLTGDTASADYPYTVAQKSPSDLFTTELDPTGSKVLLSTPYGVPPGNGNNVSFDADGNLIEVGHFPLGQAVTVPANAYPVPALPDTSGTPAACLSGEGVYALRIASRDGSLLNTQILPGTGPVALAVDSQQRVYVAGSTGLPAIPLTPGVYYDPAVSDRTVSDRTVSGGFLERTSFVMPLDALGCVTDAPTNVPAGPIAPGQLISIYGNGIGPSTAVSGLGAGVTQIPTSLGGVTVTFNGQAAPVLYASSGQINVQAPFEITGTTVMELSYQGSVVGRRMFAETAMNPSIFLAAAPTNCSVDYYGVRALALNQDGTVNSCDNPARVGSAFTIFVNGMGTASPTGHTGMIVTNPRSVSMQSGLFAGYSLEVDAFADQPGGVSGVSQLTARVPSTVATTQALELRLSVGGVVAGPLSAGGIETPAFIFVKP
jgi:uncharacterized protein (TIGR03437 family)